MSAEILIELLGRVIGPALEEALGTLDLFWARTFGHPLSGRFGRIEIQTLFHGNTRDHDQI